MITGLTIAALLGTWNCTTPGEPLSRVRETYAHGGKAWRVYSISGKPSSALHTEFTYAIESSQSRYDGYLIARSPKGFPTRVRVHLHGNQLSQTAQQFFRENEGWITSPDQETYYCTRER